MQGLLQWGAGAFLWCPVHTAEEAPLVFRLSPSSLPALILSAQRLTVLVLSDSSISEVNESSRTGHLISLSFTFQLLGILPMNLLLLFQKCVHLKLFTILCPAPLPHLMP